jgi:hypothetical protein
MRAAFASTLDIGHSLSFWTHWPKDDYVAAGGKVEADLPFDRLLIVVTGDGDGLRGHRWNTPAGY